MGLEIMAGAALLGTAFQAFGQIQQGQQQAAMASYNAQVARQQGDVARQNADAEREAARVEADDIRRRGSRVQSGLRAAAGASGLIADQGSPYELLLSNAEEIELDAQRRLFKGEVDARKQLVGADRYGQEAVLQRYQGDTARTGSYFASGATLLQGGTRAYTVLSGVPKTGTGTAP